MKNFNAPPTPGTISYVTLRGYLDMLSAIASENGILLRELLSGSNRQSRHVKARRAAVCSLNLAGENGAEIGRLLGMTRDGAYKILNERSRG